MIDLFSVVLSSAVSWGVNRLLNSVVECYNCHSREYVDVDNIEYNDFSCGHCGHNLPEYINATDHTVNRNGSIVAAQVHGITWPAWRNTFQLDYRLDVVNSKYQEIAVELLLSEFRGGEFHRYEAIYTPSHEYTNWNNNWIRIAGSNFPDYPCTVAIDLNIYNVWGDLIDNKRRLMQYRSG